MPGKEARVEEGRMRKLSESRIFADFADGRGFSCICLSLIAGVAIGRMSRSGDRSYRRGVVRIRCIVFFYFFIERTTKNRDVYVSQKWFGCMLFNYFNTFNIF